MHVKSILLVEQNKFIWIRFAFEPLWSLSRSTNSQLSIPSTEDALCAYSKALTSGTTESNITGLTLMSPKMVIFIMAGKLPIPQQCQRMSCSNPLPGPIMAIPSPISSDHSALHHFDQNTTSQWQGLLFQSSFFVRAAMGPLLVSVSPPPNPELGMTSCRIHGAADFVWSVPLPKLDPSHRDEMVSVLIKKRGKRHKTLQHCHYS